MSTLGVESRSLLWSGEHWINYLRIPGEDCSSGMVSLYRTYYSSAGEGTTAFVDIPGVFGLPAMCTDNRTVSDFILATMIRGKNTPFDLDLPTLDAQFVRGGDVRTSPYWTIHTASREIMAVWSDIRSPVVMYGPAPSGAENIEVFSTLFFTEQASIYLDGNVLKGLPYTRDIWRSSIGGDRSSCVFALGETTVKIG